VSCSHPGMEMATAGEQAPVPSRGPRLAIRTRAFRSGCFALAGVIAAVGLAAFSRGCGRSDETLDPLLSRVDQGRDAQALSSLQQALITATLVRTESGSFGAGPDDLAQRLQAKDPSKRFATTPSTGPEQIQVLGGGATPAMLVVQSTSRNYLAVWSDGNATAYYRGTQPPALVTQLPVGGGWSEQPGVIRAATG
jgi:hypothetical protein